MLKTLSMTSHRQGYVTNDLKEFLVKNPPVEAKITEWKVNDFDKDLNRISHSRNFFRGQQLYTALACAQCHQSPNSALGAHHAIGHAHGSSQAASSNLAVGPKVNDTLKKYKGDAKAVLQEIIEPSRNIEEKYRKFKFELEDDVFVSGNIVLEDVDSITIQTGTIGAPEQKIARKRIVSRSPSPLSIMPAALLNTLDKEQILDLLAFVLADGNADSLSFKKEVPPQK